MMKIADFKFDLPAPATPRTDAVHLADAVQPGGTSAPGGAGTLEALFRQLADSAPDAVALTDDSTSLTFAALDELSLAVAGFILSHGHGPEAAVGVLCRRGAHYLAAALGVLRAGAVYVPVERDLSPVRQEAMLRPVSMIVTDSHCLREAEYYRYRNPGIRQVLCIDLADPGEFLEKGTGLGSTVYWEGLAEAGSDLGWKSWFDGQPLPGDVLSGMAATILAATGLADSPRRRVLDVGCGSGVVAAALASQAERYAAVDIARNELDRTGQLGATSVVKVHQMEAVDICFLSGEEYDLVCLNGVVENFPGYNYLRRVLDHAVRLLAEGGTLYVGAVRDLDGRDAFRAALREHAEQTGESAGLLRLDGGAELFVPERFFAEWAAHSPAPVRVSVSRHDAAHRDLAHCYDVVIRRAAQPSAPVQRGLYGMDSARRISRPASPELPVCAPEQAAYIVYTSGSTGMPKGVVVEHRNLLHIIAALREYSDGCRKAALVAPLSFDASIQQLAVSLFCGKPLHVMSDEARKSPEQFCASVRRHGVDLCDMTPAFFNVLVEHLHARREPLPMARLLLAGEVLRPDAIRKFYAIPGNEKVVLYNVYGPTECTVDSSAFRIEHGNHAAYSAYPIGRPLAGVEVTVRDGDGNPLPEGVTGELWISGAGVSRGYLNGESPGAFVMDRGRPCYRTGDYGHVRDGLLHYAGREDQQVKIRGNRVEIGEVENAIAGFPGVQQVAVVADTFSAQEGKSLAAYVVGDVDAVALRTYLEGQLPSYCVPAHYVPMVELPFSVNRKVDRKALPSPLAVRQADSSMSRGRRPEGDVEQALAAIWKRLLGSEVTDADASFFNLGGNSIMAIRLAAMVEKDMGVHVAVSELFTHPSIALLARCIAGKGVTQDGPVIRLCRREGGKNLFLFHPVGGSVFCYSHLAETLGRACTVYAVEAAGFRAERTVLNTELHRVEDLAAYYLDEILKVETRDIVFGGWSFGGLVAYETACRYASMGGEPGPVLVLDSVADNSRAKHDAAKDDVELLKFLMRDLLPFDEEVLRSLPRDEKLAYLVQCGQSTGLLPEGFSVVQMDNLLRTYRGNAIAAARYDRPTPSDLNVLLVRAVDFASNLHIVPDDDHQGWSRAVRPGNITLRWTEGTHESMISPGLAGNVAKHILEYLGYAQHPDV